MAILNERLQQIQVFLTVGMKVNTRDEQGRTPLMIACFMSNKKKRQTVCGWLLEHGAEVEARDKFKRTILMYACATRNKFLLDKLLLHTDANLNFADLEGNTCLMYAAIEGDLNITRKILVPMTLYDVDLDARNRRGFTAYLLALKHGNVDCAKLLQKNGASARITDSENYWNGDRWLESHQNLRLNRESMQSRVQMRARSQMASRRNVTQTEIIQRPTSTPPSLPSKRDKNAYIVKAVRPATRILVKKPVSATVNVHVLTLLEQPNKGHANALRKRAVTCKPSIRKEVISRGKGSIPTISLENTFDSGPEGLHDAIGDYDAIIRPPTRTSQHSETFSLAGTSDYPDSVSLSVASKNRGQREQLLKIFEEYSLNQMLIPAAAREQSGTGRPSIPSRLAQFHRRTSIITESKPRKLNALRAKFNDIRTKIRTLNALKTISQDGES